MLDLLIAAQTVSGRSASETLAGDVLTFSLDYAEPPKLEAERARLAKLIGGDNFDLVAYGDDDPNILILSFPNTRREQSPGFLFETAQELTDALGLRQVEPDIGAPWRDTLSVPSSTEGVLGDIAWALCQSGKPTPAQHDWAPKLINALAIHQTGITGAGVKIGQPDTGAADHVELGAAVAIDQGYDVFTGSEGGRDPLRPDMGSPGHGTGTSSVVVSAASHLVKGSAPGATLYPLRCVDSVVIGFGGRVAKAIDRARNKGYDVVTMSLGGPKIGNALKRAIERAVAADMIVLAAAGNCVGWVTQPARQTNVIAIAATNENDVAWTGTCSGRPVDVSAPGENVTVAQRLAIEPGAPADPDAGKRVNPRGQGTSFAVALTAGVAALWIEHHTRPKIEAQARSRGVSVQDLFRAALKQSARTPGGWDTTNMGAGIVDAQALLALPLDQIGGTPHGVAPEGAMLELATLDDRFHPEAEFLNFDWHLRGNASQAGALESAKTPRPSPQLAAALAAKPEPPLHAPANIISPKTPPVDLSEALRKLGAARRSGLESTNAVTTEQARAQLRAPGGLDDVMELVEGRLEERRASGGDRVNQDAQTQAATLMREAVEREISPDQSQTETPNHRASLEALVRLTGRPALRVPKTTEALMALSLDQWSSLIKPRESTWRKLTNAVGRIDNRWDDDSPWTHVGTGFVVGPGKIMTNRHVLDGLAEPMPAPAGQTAFKMSGQSSIIFDDEATDETTRYRITSVITAGRDAIGRFVDLSKIDAAILEIEASNGTGPHPEPVPRASFDTSNTDLSEILVSGYPGRPGGGSQPQDSSLIGDFWNRIDEIFGDEYGVQYMSPGFVMKRPGTLGGDTGDRVFSHDATTLGGFSGSGILPLTGGGGYAGLHFGGATLSMNLAHDIAALINNPDETFDGSHI